MSSESAEDPTSAPPGQELPMVWERPVQAEPPAHRLPEGYRAYRVHLWMVTAALLPLIALLVPTQEVFFLAVVWALTRSTELASRLGPVLGILSSVLIVAYASNWLAMLGGRRFERRLRALLAERFGREGGDVVGIATPDPSSRYRRAMEGHADVGVLYLDDDALVFEGLRQRLVITRSDLLDVRLAPNWQFIQFRGRWCVLRHRTHDGDREGSAELRLVCRTERTILRNVRATRSLEKRVRSWWGLR